MGNCDLAIIINDWAYILSGKEYNNVDEAIGIAIAKYEHYIETLKQQAEKPEEIESDIRKIQVYEIVG